MKRIFHFGVHTVSGQIIERPEPATRGIGYAGKLFPTKVRFQGATHRPAGDGLTNRQRIMKNRSERG